MLAVVEADAGAALAGETPGTMNAVTVTALVTMLRDDCASRAREKRGRVVRGSGVVTTPPFGTRQTSLTKSASLSQATQTSLARWNRCVPLAPWEAKVDPT